MVAGLTNNSYLAESHEVRSCVWKYHSLGKSVLDVAKRRLDNMLYVGLTEDHKGSATMFAHVVGAQVISQLVGSNSTMEHLPENISEHSSSLMEFESENAHHKSSPVDENTSRSVSSEVVEETGRSKMTVEELMETYGVCITSLRKSQARRRINSLKRISPVNFTKEARLQVPDTVIKQIISLNRLDMELYKYAQDIFAEQHQHTVQKLQDVQDSLIVNTFAAAPWKDILLVMFILFVVLAVFLFVNARRRMSKVKI